GYRSPSFQNDIKEQHVAIERLSSTLPLIFSAAASIGRGANDVKGPPHIADGQELRRGVKPTHDNNAVTKFNSDNPIANRQFLKTFDPDPNQVARRVSVPPRATPHMPARTCAPPP